MSTEGLRGILLKIASSEGTITYSDIAPLVGLI